MTAEEWRDIPGHSGYQASDLGDVRSVDRVVRYRDGRLRPFPGVVLKQRTDDGGYRVVSLPYADGRKGQRDYGVHRLVCLAWHGLPPFEGAHAAHDNGKRSENRESNIYWATPAQNMADKKRHGTDAESRITHCPKQHEYTPENTWRNSKGYRSCRTCNRLKARHRLQRSKSN